MICSYLRAYHDGRLDLNLKSLQKNELIQQLFIVITYDKDKKAPLIHHKLVFTTHKDYIKN